MGDNEGYKPRGYPVENEKIETEMYNPKCYQLSWILHFSVA